MSFERVIMTSQMVREFTAPPLADSPVKSILETLKATSHVTPAFGMALAQKVIGDTLALSLVRTTPSVLVGWLYLIELHGWSNALRVQDLQLNLLINAVKESLLKPPGIVATNQPYELIKKVAGGHTLLEEALVDGLILKDGMKVPWILVSNLSTVPGDTQFGSWAA